ncbi:glutathione S-transferase family protein [Acidovorax sp. GBBC 3334]|uniref:glutathione S-transferase family protein n=1 Tax=unclassified Acidovorax TaxID=2684926 RepID=UPI002303CB90|nr:MULTISPECIES: glutathione S-transferase family protein [unclassified Acidovorax]MDA8455870.1 glutathione S-transferase family protein [Acidovorax sp. GBBC 3334]MDA8523067.1 glutathione S-transferase family protein [Acidovorax sp. NCPPB 4044]
MTVPSSPSALTLYYARGTCALAVRIALEEAGADYTLARLDFAAQQQHSPEYLALNPKGRVPALVTETGVLTETPALLAYVAQRFAQARLAPVAPHAFARMQEFHSYLASTVHVAHAHGRRGARWADEPEAIAAMQRKVAPNMVECFELIERHYLQGTWVLGEDYSVSDAYLFSVAGWLQSDGVDIAQFPKVQAHHRRMAERPAVQAAMKD